MMVSDFSDFDGNGINEIDFLMSDGVTTSIGKKDFDATIDVENNGGVITLFGIDPVFDFTKDIRAYETHDFDGDGDEDILISYLDNQLTIADNKTIVCSADNFNFQPTGQEVEFNGNETKILWDTYEHGTKCQVKGNNDLFPDDLSFLMNVEPAQPLTFERTFNNLQPNTTYRWKVRCGCSISPLVASSFTPYHYFTTPAFQGGENEMQLEDGQLKSIDDKEFEVYPNPSDGVFLLKQIKAGNLIEVINSKGQIVFSETVSETSLSLDLSHLADGSYQLLLYSGNTKKVKQIVLKH